MGDKVCSREKIISQFKDGQRILIGGQANHGIPNRLIDCLIESGVKHITTISLDTGEPNLCIGKLFHCGVVDKIITPYSGKNSEVIDQYNNGKVEIELVPMGSLVEKVRCAGLGLGGVLTRTGIGTLVEENREVVEVDGEKYILEPALYADLALTFAKRSDRMGNLVYHGTGYSSNHVFAMSAKKSIVEAEEIVETGTLNIDEIKTPFAFVDMILDNGKE